MLAELQERSCEIDPKSGAWVVFILYANLGIAGFRNF
jgi:hypothetical protein